MTFPRMGTEVPLCIKYHKEALFPFIRNVIPGNVSPYSEQSTPLFKGECFASI